MADFCQGVHVDLGIGCDADFSRPRANHRPENGILPQLVGRFNQSAELGRDRTTPFPFPSCQVGRQRVFEFAELFEFALGFGERRLGHGNDTATSFFALAAQAHDPSDFIETETERLRFANEPHLLQRSIVIQTITARRARWLREKPAPLVEANGVGLHSRKLCQPANQQGLFIHRVSNAACSPVIRPSNMIAPSTMTVGIARTP